MPLSKRGVEIPQGQFEMCGFYSPKNGKTREAFTRARLTDLLHRYRDAIRAVREAASARGGLAGLTRKRNVVQARLVDGAVKEAASAAAHAPLTRKKAIRVRGGEGRVWYPPTENETGTSAGADIPLASLTDDIRRKKKLGSVMPHESDEAEDDPRRPLPEMGMDTGGGDEEPEDGQVHKESVNYHYSGDEDRQCGSCKFFDEPSGCQKVSGIIRRVDVCRLFEGRALEALRVFRRNMRKYPR